MGFKRDKIALRIDRTLAGKWYSSLLWLVGVCFSVLLIFTLGVWAYYWFHGYHHRYGFFTFFRRVLIVFLDPGSVWSVNDFYTLDQGERDPNCFAIVLAMLGMILFIGMFISLLSNTLERRAEKLRNGNIDYKVKDHIVIIGFNDLVPMLVEQLLTEEKGASYIIIQSCVPAEEVRRKVFAETDDSLEKKVLFLYARRDSKEELKKLNTMYARKVYILGDADEEERDSYNIDCLSTIIEIHKGCKVAPKELVKFYVMFQCQTTYAAFQTNDLSQEWRTYIDFRPFNFYEDWAHRILVKRSWGRTLKDNREILYPSLFPVSMPGGETPDYVHVIIVGMNKMGRALGVEIAQLLHFPGSFDEKGDVIPGRKTIVTFIDKEADEKMNRFRNQYRHYFQLSSCRYYEKADGLLKETILPPTNGLGVKDSELDYLDVEFEFIKSSVFDPLVQQYISSCASDNKQHLSLAICFADSSRSLETAMYLPDNVYDRNTTIFVRQANSSALLASLGCKDNGATGYRRYASLYPFGMLDCSLENDDEFYVWMARLVKWEYDKDRKENQGIAVPDERKLKDNWHDSPVALLWSNMYAALSIYPKLYALGINPAADFDLSADQVKKLTILEHARWNMEKLMLGYRRCTAVEFEEIRGSKDRRNEYKARFVHSLIVPFSQLSKGDKEYDSNIVSSIPKVLKRAKAIYAND